MKDRRVWDRPAQDTGDSYAFTVYRHDGLRAVDVLIPKRPAGYSRFAARLMAENHGAALLKQDAARGGK